MTTVSGICVRCGNQTAKRYGHINKYCSNKCQFNRPVNLVSVACKQCGKPTPPSKRSAIKQYCSKSCRLAYSAPKCKNELCNNKVITKTKCGWYRYCSDECKNRGVSIQPKPCIQCGAVMVKPPGESNLTFASRKYCGKGCFSNSRKNKDTRSCVVCKNSFNCRARDSQRFCSRECASALNSKSLTTEGMSYEEIAERLNLTIDQVKRIEAMALIKLRAAAVNNPAIMELFQ